MDESKIAALHQFLDAITAAVRDGYGTFGTTLSHLQGMSAGHATGQELYEAAGKFARAYGDSRVTGGQLQGIMYAVEAALLKGQTLGAISDVRAAELIEMMHKLVENR